LGLGLAAWGRAVHGPSLAQELFTIRIGATAVAAGAAAAVVGAGLVLAMSLPHVLRTVQQERQQASREERPLLARFPLELLAGGLGAAAFWEVKRRGLGAEHGSIDPLVLLAPTLLLFATSFFALGVLLWVFRRLDGPVGRTRNFAVYLAGRRLGRSTSLSFATALLLLLATGLLVVSSSYRHTLLTAHADVARQRVGATWAVATQPAAQSLAALGRVPSGDTPLYRGQVEGIDTSAFSSDDVDVAAAESALSVASVIGVDPATYPAGGWWRDDYSPRPLSDLLHELGTEQWGTALPPGTRRLSATVSAPGSLAGFGLRAVVASRLGATRTVALGTLSAGRQTYAANAPGAAWLLSIVIDKGDITLAPPAFTLQVGGVQAVTPAGPTAVDLEGWRALRWHGSSGDVRAVSGALEATLHPGGATVTAGVAPPGGDLPAAVSPDLGFLEGRDVDVVVCGMALRLRLGPSVARFPGEVAPSFVIVSAPRLFAELSRVPQPCGGINEVRSMSGASPVHALEAAGFAPTGVRDAHAIEATLSQDPQTIALGMHFAGAAGGMVLVVIGLGVALYFGQRRRTFEFAALRSLGASHRQLVGTLAAEQGLLTAFAIGVAMALGYGLLALILPYAAGDLSTSVPPGSLTMDWPAILGLAAAAVAVVIGGLAMGMRSLFASSVPSVLRGEAE
ncbi:MAG TPA: ABC transporter permease, partial [Actinomycetota bacterium]|nr:ABC transporter permease [Actinomycetota bacterium]